ncbi:MAG: argininosuccinate lyase, partial [Roseiflexus castenholzii]
ARTDHPGAAVSWGTLNVAHRQARTTGAPLLQVFDMDRSAAQRRVPGATAPRAVREQIIRARQCLGEH